MEAGVELKRARKSISFIRFLFGMNALFAALYLLVSYQGMIESDVTAFGPEIWIGLILLTGLLAFSVVGFVRVTLEPFVWAVLLASLSTLERVLELLAREFNLIGIVWTIVIWCFVPATIGLRRILREHPDHYGVQSLQGTHREARSLKRKGGRIGKQDAAALARLSRKRLAARTAVALAVVVGGSGALAGVSLASRPTTAEPFLDALVAEWNAGDVAALAARFAAVDNNAAENFERLRSGPRAGALPTLGEPVVETIEGPKGLREWRTDAGRVIFEVERVEGNWLIERFLPPVPPFGDLSDAFRSAWNANDVEGVAALYEESSREKLLRSLPRTFTRRGWVDEEGRPELPELAEPRLYGDRGIRRDFAYDSEVGEFESTFRIGEDGTWVMTSLDLPRR